MSRRRRGPRWMHHGEMPQWMREGKMPPWAHHGEMPRWMNHGPWAHNQWARKISHWHMRRVLFFWSLLTVCMAMAAVTFAHRAFGGGKWMHILLALGVVWFFSGVLAHRLARPIVELADAAKAFGLGNFDRRVDLRRLRGSEAFVLGTSFNDMATRIEQMMEHQRALLSTVSHELRTPLARLRVELELLRNDPTAQHRLRDAEQEVEAMDALVGDVLAHSRVESGAAQQRETALRDVAIRAVESARIDPSLLVVDAAEGLTLQADITLLVRALCILLSNAESHGGGVVEFRVSVVQGPAQADRATEIDGYARFEVDDDGPGVEAGEEQRIFEPFYERAKHLGLGLSLVQRIARAHGGRAGLTRRSQGSRFWIEVPLSAERSGARGEM